MKQSVIDDGGISLCMFQSGRMDFITAMLVFADEWGKEKGMNVFVSNTSNGSYEIIGIPKKV
jgi:hypothetical protein